LGKALERWERVAFGGLAGTVFRKVEEHIVPIAVLPEVVVLCRLQEDSQFVVRRWCGVMWCGVKENTYESKAVRPTVAVGREAAMQEGVHLGRGYEVGGASEFGILRLELRHRLRCGTQGEGVVEVCLTMNERK